AWDDRGATGGQLWPSSPRFPGRGCGGVWRKALSWTLFATGYSRPEVSQNKLIGPEGGLGVLDRVLRDIPPRPISLAFSPSSFSRLPAAQDRRGSDLSAPQRLWRKP